MLWFKHENKARKDIKLRRLQEKFGNDGYSSYFKLLEMIAEEDALEGLHLSRYPLNHIAIDCLVNEKKMMEILREMAELDLISKRDLADGIIYPEDFAKRADNYSRYGKQKVKEVDLKGIKESELYKYCEDNRFFSAIKNLAEFLLSLIEIYGKEEMLLRELKKMNMWLETNPHRRKKNYAKFISNWLKRGDTALRNKKLFNGLLGGIGGIDGKG